MTTPEKLKNPTNQDVLAQLEAIFQLALRDYPYESDDHPINNNLLLTLGQIAGMAGKAIADYRESE